MSDGPIEALRRAERELTEIPLSREADRRIRARIRSGGPRTSRSAWVVVSGLAFAAGALVALVMSRAPADPAPSSEGAVAGLAVGRAPCVATREGEAVVLDGACRAELSTPSMIVDAQGLAVIQRVEGGVRLLRGEALIRVPAVAAGAAPVRVEVSGGVIEVLGTRFTVRETGQGGSVVLHEGRIRLIAGDVPRALAPGQRASWGRGVEGLEPAAHEAASAPAPSASPSSRAAPSSRVVAAPRATAAASGPPPVSPITAPTAEPPGAAPSPAAPSPAAGAPGEARMVALRGLDAQTAEALDRLRAAGRHREAVALIEHRLLDAWEPRSAEVLLFEQASLLEHQLADRPAACRAYGRHRAEFALGRHAAEVGRALARLGCQETAAPDARGNGR